MSNKWEREIEELLREKFDEQGEERPRPPIKHVKPRPPRRPRWNLWKWVQSLSPERLVLYGIALAIAAYFFRPFFGSATMLLALASVVLVAGAIVVSILKRESPYVEKRWRGQIIEMPTQQGPVSLKWRRLRRTLRRWLDRLR